MCKYKKDTVLELPLFPREHNSCIVRTHSGTVLLSPIYGRVMCVIALCYFFLPVVAFNGCLFLLLLVIASYYLLLIAFVLLLVYAFVILLIACGCFLLCCC